MLREQFQIIFDNYLTDKLAHRSMKPKSFAKLQSAQVLTGSLPIAMQAASKLAKSDFKFKGSVGLAQMAEIPHLCVFDREITDSAQQGYYIVYLFNAQFTKVYLSLNQGWTQYETKYKTSEGRKELKKNTQFIQHLIRAINHFSFEPISLDTNKRLGVGYELGSICNKVYDRDQLPDDAELIADLMNLVKVYEELKELVGKNILDVQYHKNELIFQSEIQNTPTQQLPPGPILRKEKLTVRTRTLWGRDINVAATALRNAGYACEYDANHITFKASKSGNPFMEAHHLIPLCVQYEFKYQLDVPENVICLCPNCHRAFHNAEAKEKNAIITWFYDKRERQLRERGIETKLETLIDYYRSVIED